MMYESFRTRDRLDMIVSLDYLVKLELELHYENLSYDDPKRSYSNLMNIIDRTIMRRREQSNLTQTQIGRRQMLEGKALLAAPAKPAVPSSGGKPNKGNGKPDDAAPVLPQSKAKAHAKMKAKPIRRVPGANLQIPNPTKARSTFGVSSTSPTQAAGMATNVRSVTPRRLLRPRTVRGHRVLPDAQTAKCALHSNGQDLVPGRIARSSMRQLQLPRQQKQRRKPRLRRRQSRRPRRPRSPRLSLLHLRFVCAEHGIHQHLHRMLPPQLEKFQATLHKQCDHLPPHR